jgi:protein TonB
MFEEIRRIQLADVRLPAPRRVSSRSPSAGGPSNPAPVIEPSTIPTDSGVAPTRIGGPIGAGPGDPGGLPEIESIGVPGGRPPAPPPPAAKEPVHLHSGIVAPQKVTDVAPVYPSMARIARAQGVVILEAIIDARGNVVSVQVLRSNPLLDQAAIDAVHQWRYTPALLNGQPVPVIVTITVRFQLQ